MNKCWVCGSPSVWTVTGKKEGSPVVLVEFYACEKCVPFALPEAVKKKEKADGA